MFHVSLRRAWCDVGPCAAAGAIVRRGTPWNHRRKWAVTAFVPVAYWAPATCHRLAGVRCVPPEGSPRAFASLAGDAHTERQENEELEERGDGVCSGGDVRGAGGPRR